MRFIFTLPFLLCFAIAFGQWTRVDQLPASDIFSLYKHDSILYGGGKGKIYVSRDKGQSWDSVNVAPLTTMIDAIAVYKDELYASSFNVSVYKSRDGGATWQNASAGLGPYISEFCEWQGNLYAATLGAGVFKLDSLRRDRWVSFNNGLSSLSINLNTIGATTHTLITGTLANGMVDRYSDISTEWTETFVQNRVDPNGIFYDIITPHDSIYLSGRSTTYLSTDNGISWNKVGSQLPSIYNKLVNTRQAVLVMRNTFDGTHHTGFFYLMKNSLQGQFLSFANVLDFFSYGMEIIGGNVWVATSGGLYHMPLSALPGITLEEEEQPTVINVPPPPPPPPPATYPFTVGEVFPNPTTGEAHISLSLDKAGHISANLYEASGKLVSVIADHQSVTEGNTIFSFDATKLNSGMYFLRLLINGEVFTRKVIRQP